MKNLLSTLLLLISTLISAQDIDTVVTNQLVRQTKDSYFNKFPDYVISDSVFFRNHKYVRSSEMRFSDYNVHFVSTRAEKDVIKRGLTDLIFTLKLEVLSADTLNLFISAETVDYRDFFGDEFFSYGVICRGYNGSIPEGRLVLNDSLQLWRFQSEDELIAEQKRIPTPNKGKLALPLLRFPLGCG